MNNIIDDYVKNIEELKNKSFSPLSFYANVAELHKEMLKKAELAERTLAEYRKSLTLTEAALREANQKAERYERALNTARYIVENSRRTLFEYQNTSGLIPHAQIDMMVNQSMIEYDLLISKALAPEQEGGA